MLLCNCVALKTYASLHLASKITQSFGATSSITFLPCYTNNCLLKAINSEKKVKKTIQNKFSEKLPVLKYHYTKQAVQKYFCYFQIVVIACVVVKLRKTCILGQNK